MGTVGWLPTAELSFVCPDHREQPRVSLGSGKGSQKLLILPAANSHPPQLKGTPSPAHKKKPAGAAELARLHPPPPQPGRLCALVHPQEAAASSGETAAQGREGRQYPARGSAERSPVCRWMAAHLHPRQPAALGGNGCDRNLFWPTIRSRLVSGRGGEKSRELEVLWIVKGVCAWTARIQRRVGGISREAELWRVVGFDVQASGCPIE